MGRLQKGSTYTVAPAREKQNKENLYVFIHYDILAKY